MIDYLRLMRCLLTIVLLLALPLGTMAKPAVTTYARMVMELNDDATRCPDLRLASFGTSATGKRKLWVMRVADPAIDPAHTLRLLVLCRQHGDEPASTEAVLGLLRRIANGGDSGLRKELTKVTLYLVPMVNPDGAEAGTRVNGGGADLNRDWGIFHQPETCAVARLVTIIRPQVLLDAHNWDGGDTYDADCVEIARTMTTPLGEALHTFQSATVTQLMAAGYHVHPTAYGNDSDPHLAHRYFTQRGLLSCLVETHAGVPNDQIDFQRRQGMYVALIHIVARDYSSATAQAELNGMEGYAKPLLKEAALFQPPSDPNMILRSHLHTHPSRVWIWAICLYGLALWAKGTKSMKDNFQPVKARRTTTRRSVRTL